MYLFQNSGPAKIAIVVKGAAQLLEGPVFYIDISYHYQGLPLEILEKNGVASKHMPTARPHADRGAPARNARAEPSAGGGARDIFMVNTY